MRGLRASTLTRRVIALLRMFSSPGSGSMPIEKVFDPASPQLNTNDSVRSRPSEASVTSRLASTFPLSRTLSLARLPENP